MSSAAGTCSSRADREPSARSHPEGRIPATSRGPSVSGVSTPSHDALAAPTGERATDSTDQRLAALGLKLPQTVKPSHLFEPARYHRGTVTTSGQVPLRDGVLLARGTLGVDVDLATAQECARQCTLNALAAIADEIGGLDRVETTTRMLVFVASAVGFDEQPAVADAASALLREILGERGNHARSAVGVSALPRSAPVEIELSALVVED